MYCHFYNVPLLIHLSSQPRWKKTQLDTPKYFYKGTYRQLTSYGNSILQSSQSKRSSKARY